MFGHMRSRAVAIIFALALAGCARAGAGLLAEGRAEAWAAPASAVPSGTLDEPAKGQLGKDDIPDPPPAKGPPVEAAPAGVSEYVLSSETKLRVFPAQGEMPAATRTVQLLQLEQGVWREVNAVNLSQLPGDTLSFQQTDLAGHAGAIVIEADRTGDRKGVRKGALAVENGRLFALDYYRLVAPEPEVRSGTFLYENKYLNQVWVFRDGQLVATFATANGREPWGTQPTWDDFKQNYTTPEGLFQIVQKVTCPPYNSLSGAHPSEPGCAPLNPLGTRWIGLAVLPGDAGGIWGFHGTYVPDQIGTWASEGCIRLNTRDAEALFDLVEVGTPVRIVAGK